MELQANIHDSAGVITISSNILGTPADSKEFEKNVQQMLGKGIKKLILASAESTTTAIVILDQVEY